MLRANPFNIAKVFAMARTNNDLVDRQAKYDVRTHRGTAVLSVSLALALLHVDVNRSLLFTEA
jgi:hypothetical protein